ncbi:MAG TPA: NADH-quinone oxidoreductase subunit H [Candidatus Copromorpha excrementavium]|uniref:NADH-quinone oxidoreductase subunit H n=1 Tax=Candidatus Allocopromorpha excrementavium TaxID=2840741 RepID=A0A9D1HDY8_9FIRM|nr:NADH-quinone oxidoreductase subunit H [Candidatus Copromorpha excrementavium]
MIIRMIITIIVYLILAPFAGALLEGCGRKFAAALQGRRGPSVMQPFRDMKKLMEKNEKEEYIHGYYVKVFLLFMVAAGAAFSAGLDITFIVLAMLSAYAFLIISAYVTGSPYARAGAENEMMRILSFVPMIMLMAVGFQMYCGSMNVGDIVIGSSMPVLPMIGILAGFVFICSAGMRRNDELVSEFAGKTLAIVKIAKWYEVVLMLGFVFLFFCNGSFAGYCIGAAASILIYLLEIFIESCFAGVKKKYVFGAAWLAAAVLGVTNIFMLYVII